MIATLFNGAFVTENLTEKLLWHASPDRATAPTLRSPRLVFGEALNPPVFILPPSALIPPSSVSRHVIIIGGGVIGLSSALAARRKGLEVTVVDDRPPLHHGCSFGNAGMIVPSHVVPLAAPGMVALGLKWMWNPESPFYIRPRLSLDLLRWGYQFWKASTKERVSAASRLLAALHLDSRRRYEQLAADGLDFGLVQRGLLMLCQTQQTLDEEAHAAEFVRQLGIPANVLDRTETDALDPDVHMSVCGAVHFPLDAHFDPGRFMQSLHRLVQTEGVRILRSKPVTGIEREGRRIRAVRSENETIDGDEFVLAAGSWSTGLGQQLDLSLPMQPGKGYSLTLPNPRCLPQLCSILTEARVALTPMGARLRVGGTMEMSGLNEAISPKRVQGIIRSFVRYFPEFTEADFEGISPWAGLRPCAPDGLPYLGRTSRFENLTIATGHAMMGMSLGPVTGEIVGQLLTGEQPAHDLTLVSPDRFG